MASHLAGASCKEHRQSEQVELDEKKSLLFIQNVENNSLLLVFMGVLLHIACDKQTKYSRRRAKKGALSLKILSFMDNLFETYDWHDSVLMCKARRWQKKKFT